MLVLAFTATHTHKSNTNKHPHTVSSVQKFIHIIMPVLLFESLNSIADGVAYGITEKLLEIEFRRRSLYVPCNVFVAAAAAAMIIIVIIICFAKQCSKKLVGFGKSDCTRMLS